jgi:hypothetical protein
MTTPTPGTADQTRQSVTKYWTRLCAESDDDESCDPLHVSDD